jgi:hypothetical protein
LLGSFSSRVFGWKVGTNPDGFDPLLGCLDGGWGRDGLNPKGIFANYAGWARPPDFDGRSRSRRVGLVHVPSVHPPAPPYPFTPNLIPSGREEPDAALHPRRPPNARRRAGLSTARGAPVSPPPAARRSLPEAASAARRSSEVGRPREGCRRSGLTPPAPPPPDAASSDARRRGAPRSTAPRCISGPQVHRPKVQLSSSLHPPSPNPLLLVFVSTLFL